MRGLVAAMWLGLSLLGPQSWGRQDLNADGIPDVLMSQVGFEPMGSAIGRVEVRSGADGLLLLTLSSGVLDDAFGFAAEIIPDIDSDLVPEIAISAPRAMLQSDRVGRVFVYSGATGTLIRSLMGRRGDRLGLALADAGDINGDGMADILAAGMALGPSGRPGERILIFSGQTGRLLFDQTYLSSNMPPAVLEPREIRGDLNENADLDTGDLIELNGQLAEGAGPDAGGDLNEDNEVDVVDLVMLVNAVSSGVPPVPPDQFTLTPQEITVLNEALGGWSALYPEDPIVSALAGQSTQAGRAFDWWTNGFFRHDGSRLFNRWIDVGCLIRINKLGQRASGIDPNCPCDACVTIEDCPASIKVGQDFAIHANWCPDCDQKYWTIRNGSFTETVYGDVLSYRVDFTEQPLPGVLVVTAYCVDEQGPCTASDSCTIELADCTLELEGCPVEAVEGEAVILGAHGEPPGGTYTWQIVADEACAIEGFEPAGPNCTVTTATVPPALCGQWQPGIVPWITVKVRYEKDGCVQERVCMLPVVLDSDDDGVTDEEELEDGTDPGDPDSDNDGISDGDERDAGSDPNDADSDNDGASDGEEAAAGTNPNDEDSDDDDVLDGCELALVAYHTEEPWDPLAPNDPAADSDSDGLPDLEEACDPGYGTDPGEGDTDRDRTSDSWELEFGLDPVNGDDGAMDADMDGLLNWQEYAYGTSPLDDDSDDDAVSDGDEIAQGSSPTSERSTGPGDGVPVTLSLSNPGGDARWDLGVSAWWEWGRLIMPDHGIAPEPLTVFLEPGEYYDIGANYFGDGKRLPGWDYSYCAGVDLEVGDNQLYVLWDDSDIPEFACDEDRSMLGCWDVPGRCDRTDYRTVLLFLPTLDVDTDSDNNGHYDRTQSEEDSEDVIGDPMHPGKLVFAASGDSDGDGIPDFADGYDLLAETPDDDESPQHRSPTIVIEIKGYPWDDQMRFSIDYDASDPAAVQYDAETGKFRPPPVGRVRVWRKPTQDPRNSASILDGGDFVPPGIYTIEELGLSTIFIDNGGIGLYVESLVASEEPGDQPVQIAIYGDVAGQYAEETVRFTCLDVQFPRVNDDGSLERGSMLSASHPTPVIALTPPSEGQIQVYVDPADPTRLLADLAFSFGVDDAASDLIGDPIAGTISQVEAVINGPSDEDGVFWRRVIPLSTSKVYDAGSILGVFDFTGSASAGAVAQSMSGVPVVPGANTVRLIARNAYGLAGYAEFSFQVNVTPPAWSDEEHPPPDFSEYALGIGEVSAVTASDGGDVQTFLVELLGPPDMNALIDEVQWGGSTYAVVPYQDGLFLALQGSGVPRAFIAMPNMFTASGTSEDEIQEIFGPRRDGKTHFIRGFGAGMLDSGISVFDGITGVCRLVWHMGRYYNGVSMSLRLIDGDSAVLEDDARQLRAGFAVVDAAGEIAWKLIQDEAGATEAALTENSPELAALGLEYSQYFMIGAEIYELLREEIDGLDSHDAGYVYGRIIGETAVTCGTVGVGQALKGVTMQTVLGRLSTAQFFVRRPGLQQKLGEAATIALRVLNNEMCFVAGTVVWTASGPVPIEEVRVGDMILSRDPVTGVDAYSRVDATIVTHPSALCTVAYAGPGGVPVRLVCTPEHPFFVLPVSGGPGLFLPARSLAAGDRLVFAEGGTGRVAGLVLHPSDHSGGLTTYNLEVADFHTYFVGPHGVWVHNKGKLSCEELFALLSTRRRTDPNLPLWHAWELTVAHVRTLGDKELDDTALCRASMKAASDAFREQLERLDRGESINWDADVPTYSKARDLLTGPLGRAAFEVHHTGYQELAAQVFAKRGITAPDLNTMPGLPMPISEHNYTWFGGSRYSFHSIIRSEGYLRNELQTYEWSELLDGLNDAYAEMHRRYSAQSGIDYLGVARLTREWFRHHGVQ